LLVDEEQEEVGILFDFGRFLSKNFATSLCARDGQVV
jgi:hypothetical protein